MIDSKITKPRKGHLQRKILLLLSAGVALSAARSLRNQWRILKDVKKEWKETNKGSLERSLNSLYRSKLIKEVPGKKGVTTFVLTDSGKKRILEYNIEEIKIKRPKSWDGLWRIVMFDVPERRKKGREVFRYHLKQLGFVELQRSVFIFPFSCEKEIKYIVEFHKLNRYVRFALATVVDNDEKLKRIFKL